MTLKNLHVALDSDLKRIAGRFKTKTKITLLIRQPEVDGDPSILLTDDDGPAAIAELQKRFDPKVENREFPARRSL